MEQTDFKNVTEETQFCVNGGLHTDLNQCNRGSYANFKNVIVENIHWALFEDAEVAEVKRPRNSKRRKFYYKK